jgi:hypothetical protein
MDEAERQHHLRVITTMRQRHGARFWDTETYTYALDSGGFVTWDTTLAKRLIARRTAGIDTLDLATMRAIVARTEVGPVKFALADPRVPGIGGQIRLPEASLEGAPEEIVAQVLANDRIINILIDGSHRLAKALRQGVPFQVRRLTEADNRRCIVEAPPGVIP